MLFLILESPDVELSDGAGESSHLLASFEGLLRLRVGNHRVMFDETEDTITIHRVGDRRQAYR